MAEQHSNKNSNIAPNQLMLLITVVHKGKGTFFSDFLQSFGANLQVCLVGTGTAEANLIEFLGLKDSKRSVIFSVVREDQLDAIFEALEERFVTVNRGTGISYAIPLSSVIGKLSYGFLSNDSRVIKGDQS